jgi:nicotinamidase-related amidase
MNHTELLTPQNSALILIDFQPQMVFGVTGIDRQTLFNNVMILAKAAKIFGVPTILTTVESKRFSGNMWPQILDIFPNQEPVERSSMNSWEDASGGTSVTAHNAAMRRIEQAGAVPMTALQLLLEYQRDWARKDTYDSVIEVVKEHCGAYGQGVEYAYTIVHGAPPSRRGTEH